MDKLLKFSQKFPWQQLVPLLLAASFLALPMSSTGKSICLGLSVLAILLSPSYRTDLSAIFFQNWCKAAILLFFLVLCAFLWSPANYSERFFVLEKYSKLLYLPILAAGFREAKTREIALHAFLLAMAFISVVSILLFYGYLYLPLNPDNLFRNHIIIGFMVAFAAYLSLLFAYQKKGISRLFYGALLLLFSYKILFVNAGRMSYIIYGILLFLFVMQVCSWRQAILGICFICTLIITSYFQSPVFNSRLNLAVQDLTEYQQKRDTPVGYRLQFHNYAYHLFCKHPLIGNGTGSFTYYFRTEKPVPGWDHRLLEPHSQYWLIASEFGLVGIGGFFLLFWYLFKASWNLRSTRYIAVAMLIAFLVGSLTDSLLFYSGPGYFFILFMSLCLGEQIRQPVSETIHQSPWGTAQRGEIAGM